MSVGSQCFLILSGIVDVYWFAVFFDFVRRRRCLLLRCFFLIPPASSMSVEVVLVVVFRLVLVVIVVGLPGSQDPRPGSFENPR